MEQSKLKLLLKSILSLESEEECLGLLEDLCTINEIEDMSHRMEIAYLLNQGKTFYDVQAQTGASSTTISRVSRCLKHGRGYKMVLDKIVDKKS
ncbi:DNA-binding transcriptional regulator [Alkalibaculum sp. M08DMB]|uniref:DNA-binding transcriptional regulator n=1 Tax=Alkalibaculum sporogenes TaxID=2655001 RepID=A0A6A7KBM5_9FIRM|nr:YerC/YecD family TrpR-related protein [Alkalibaculum sporogenes]MPW26587.1 DNA-binding transcriptional regulator [Alkalibaculum sporogenes]